MQDLSLPCPACQGRCHRFDQFCPSCGVAVRTINPGGPPPPSPIAPLGHSRLRPLPWRVRATRLALGALAAAVVVAAVAALA